MADGIKFDQRFSAEKNYTVRCWSGGDGSGYESARTYRDGLSKADAKAIFGQLLSAGRQPEICRPATELDHRIAGDEVGDLIVIMA